jgi:transposase
MRNRIDPRQISFDFLSVSDDNQCTSVHEKTPCRCFNSGMGAGHSGGSRPNGVIATPILTDPPFPGKGRSMSANITPVEAKALCPTEARRQRGLAIAALTRITQVNGYWVVPSQTGNGSYRVNLKPTSAAVPMCTCKDFATRDVPCKHVYAVRAVIERESKPEVAPSVPEALPDTRQTKAPRPTYKQVWPAYNKAQIQEKARFQSLLSELARGIPEPPPKSPKGGRKPLPLADQVFACALKVYTTISGRRASTDMREAEAKGHLSHAPDYSRVYRYLEDPAMTPILVSLIAQSARPLASVEVDFAVDSSGFATSRFVRWFDHKYGITKQEYDWVKVSICTGRTTNVITAVAIDERYAADCPAFAPLVKTTAERFTIREVSADSAYLSYDNMDLVASHGGTPFIAFPSNTTAAQGGTLAKMFHLYNFHREEYLAHYHKRSNVESSFSMVKAKFGDSLRSKTDVAMRNEALCKILCHNLCCLIQSIYELGIEATFWEPEGAEKPAESTLAIGDESIECWAWV